MSRRKLWNNAWTVVLIVSLVCQFALGRPSLDVEQDATDTTKNLLNNITKPSESPIRSTTVASKNVTIPATTPASLTSAPRDVKNGTPVIGESIKMVANQLLQSTKSPVDVPVIEDTRTPPKMKNHIVSKNKTKVKPEKVEEKIENSHAGVAVPVTIEELEKNTYFHDIPKETSTSHEGISTWILLSNPSSTSKPKKNENKSPAETSSENPQKKPKPINKNKPKKPNNGTKTSTVKRPIIASTNKSDLIAGGSAMNENMFNKIKATVLANVQKNKNAAVNRETTIAPTTLTTTSTTPSTTTTTTTTKKDVTTTKAPPTVAVTETITEKPKTKKKKKKNKNKTKTQSTIDKESASLPMEAKEQEIELEISTPPTTTKKPKRTSTKRKKNKTKKRKPSTKEDEAETSETSISNSTKLAKPSKNNPISTQIYNYLSREVMPTVGVGIVGLAGLVGLASYFLYPFASPVRRVFEVEKKDDLYRHNAEEYANDGNGQAEEEMLGTVLAGMPANSNRVNPYVNQTPARQHVKKESDQNIRYRHVSSHSDTNSYNTHYSQPKTGIAHGAVYSDPVSYSTHYESKNIYPTENKHTVYANDNQNAYNSYSPVKLNSYSPVEPIYSAPQSGPSGPTSFGSDTANTVIYGVKPTQESSFEPVYPFEGQVFSETTSYPMTFPPTSMYLGSNNESENPNISSYNLSLKNNDNKESQFVVGNVPEELIQPVTPAVVPEHGPRKFNRKKRSINKQGLTETLEEILRRAKEEKKDTLISNEIDEALGIKPDNIPSSTQEAAMHVEPISIVTLKPNFQTTNVESVDTKVTKIEDTSEKATPLYPVYTVYPLKTKESENTIAEQIITENLATPAQSPKSTVFPESENGIVESISTIPQNTNSKEEIPRTTEAYNVNDLDFTTKTFRVYEVFPSSSSPNKNKNDDSNEITSTQPITEMETTTLYPMKNDISTSTPKTTSSENSRPIPTKYTPPPYFTSSTVGLAYPQNSIFTFIKDMFQFKFRLGMSILQATSDSLARYLKSMEGTVKKIAKASQTQE